jgi:hypothetical protein
MKTWSKQWWNMTYLDWTGEDDIKLQPDEWWSKASWLFGTGEVDIGSQWDKLWDKQGEFWDRRSWYWVITRQIMEQDKVTFGTGEVDNES